MTHEPAKKEQDGAGDKDGKARRIVPRVVDILANTKKGPEEKRACPEILNDLGGLVADRREVLAIGRIGEIGEFSLCEAESLGRFPEKQDPLEEKCKAAESEN